MAEFVELIEAISLEDRSELLGLYSDSSRDSLCQNFETLLEEHPNDLVIKLLWCDAQATSDRLPLPFVASSLLDQLEEGIVQIHHPRLSFLVTQRLTELLIKSGEFRTAIFLASDFLLKSSPKYFKSKTDFLDLKSKLLKILDEEIAQAVKKRESTNYRNSLEDTKSKIKQAKPPGKIVEKTITKKHTVEKKVDLSNPNNVETGNFVLGTLKTGESTDQNYDPETGRTEFQESEFPISQKKSRTNLLLACTMVSALLLLAYSKGNFLLNQIYSTSGYNKQDLSTQLIYETRTSEQFEPEFPTLKPFSLDNFRTSLDDINVRLAKLTKREKIDLPEPLATEAEDRGSQNDKKDLSEIESLNTVPDLNPSPSPITPVPKLPEIPSNIGNSIDLNGGTTPSRSNPTQILNSRSIPSSIKTNPDGRVFGPPAISDPTDGSKNQRALDGSALQSYEVERYDQPKIYETITATNVLAAPSLLSQSITRLKSETPIHVTARMGLWLELLSNEGKIGYIFAQDAVKK